ncbi:MAG TPA: TatD family hydrolase [bacterium]|nr:TatD family hydrolase [bacterium]HPV65079.1 TatD family hydrolase [bacterium]
MYIDTHCHLNFKDFKDDYKDVAERALSNEVEMIVVGSEIKTSSRSVSLSKEFEQGVYSAIGLHPIHLQDILIKNDNENGKYEFRSKKEEYREDDYLNLVKSGGKKIVAIGEIGLDYYHIEGDSEKKVDEVKKLQQDVFYKQLELAQKVNLPVIIHCREAHDDLFAILKDFYSRNSFKKEWGVIHCFSGNLDQAKKYWDLGLLTSFTGLITFVKQWDSLIEQAPLEKIMIETDSPYLSPTPFRGQRNEPLYVKEVAKRIAEIKKMDISIVKKEIFNTSKKFFNI